MQHWVSLFVYVQWKCWENAKLYFIPRAWSFARLQSLLWFLLGYKAPAFNWIDVNFFTQRQHSRLIVLQLSHRRYWYGLCVATLATHKGWKTPTHTEKLIEHSTEFLYRPVHDLIDWSHLNASTDLTRKKTHFHIREDQSSALVLCGGGCGGGERWGEIWEDRGRVQE